MKNRRFEGKKIIIIGAAGGLGTSYVNAFIEEGAEILLAGRSSDRLQKLSQALPQHPPFCQVDITDAASVTALAEFAGKWAERIDILVNAAGTDVRKSLDEHKIDEINKSLDTNLLGTVLISKLFLPLMRAQKGSTIVHMGGFADGRLSLPYYSVDVATRSGIFSFAESMNRELKQEGNPVRLLYFCPNSADTAAEQPYHKVWKEMGIAISTTEQVAKELLQAIAKEKEVYLMGGAATRLFAKINALSPKLADALLLKKYGQILKKHFHPEPTVPAVKTKKPNSILRKIAIGMVILSFVLYALLPVVPFLPVKLAAKATITGSMMIVSEIIFWVGGFIVGKEFMQKIRRTFSLRRLFCCQKTNP